MEMKKLTNNFFILLLISFLTIFLFSGCAKHNISKKIEVTGYCGCGKCCGWERGSMLFLKLDFWKRYITGGPQKGQEYSGLTASGTKPHEIQPGLFSMDSLKRPWMIPIRIVFFPWLFLPKDGTLAADTRFYPFGTRMYIPGYGYGVVEDRGSAIKGPYRIDAYFDSHQDALEWGRETVSVEIID